MVLLKAAKLDNWLAVWKVARMAVLMVVMMVVMRDDKSVVMMVAITDASLVARREHSKVALKALQ